MGKKRILATSLFCALTGLVLWCCAGASGQETESGKKEIRHIVMTYQTMEGSRLEHLDKVLEAVNAISREEIGVEVELLQVDAVTAGQNYPLWITQGKRMDLMVINYQDIRTYVEQSMLLPLDTLLEEYGSDILKVSEEWEDLLDSGKVKGQCYGVEPAGENKGSCRGLWIYERYLEEIDFPYEENRVYSLEELDGLFAALKEKYPDRYPLGQTTSHYSFSTATFFLTGYDALGGDVSTGVLDREEPEKGLQNFYAREDYRGWLEWLRKWYLDGYIYPEAAITASGSTELMQEGIILSIPQSGAPYFFTEESLGEPVVCLRLTPVEYGPSSSTGIFWSVPVTAGDPGAALEFLNLLYEDERIVNLFQWGIEGLDYVLTGDGAVDYPEGLDRNTVGYVNPLGLFGDQRLRYAFQSTERKKAYEAFSAQAVREGFEYAGFDFDTADVTVELGQVQKVLDRYLHVLESGSVDVETVYPEFLAALEEAGMERIIAEKQRQLDAWEAEQSEY